MYLGLLLDDIGKTGNGGNQVVFLKGVVCGSYHLFVDKGEFKWYNYYCFNFCLVLTLLCFCI